MSNSTDIVNALINEDVVLAKKLINEELFSRLGNALEEKLANYAPSVFNEAKKPKPDFLDLDGDGNKKESMKSASKSKKKTTNESVEDFDSEMLSLLENFENEIISIVQEVQEETGEELTPEEIEEIAEEYLSIIKESDE